jgi:hypothetical protein
MKVVLLSKINVIQVLYDFRKKNHTQLMDNINLRRKNNLYQHHGDIYESNEHNLEHKNSRDDVWCSNPISTRQKGCIK